MAKQSRKASEIYRKQNVAIHKALSALGMPYEANREVWLRLMTEVCKRPVTGLSELSLWERHQLVSEIRRKGARIFTPAVPKNLRDWRKGDPEISHEFRLDDDPQVRMAEAMWTEMGYPIKTLRGLCWKLFRKSDPSWLDDGDLTKLVNVVKAKAQQMGYGEYYVK